MQKSTQQSGFTLIEIIVVIAIIGILLGIATASYANSLRHGRDQKRIVNVELIRSNLELFRSSQVTGVYPTSITTGSFAALYPLPPDPQTNLTNVYTYTPLSSTGASCDNSSTYCSTYTLSTPLEIEGSAYRVTPNSSGILTASPTARPPTSVPPTAVPTARPPTSVPPTAVPTARPPTSVPPTAVACRTNNQSCTLSPDNCCTGYRCTSTFGMGDVCSPIVTPGTPYPTTVCSTSSCTSIPCCAGYTCRTAGFGAGSCFPVSPS